MLTTSQAYKDAINAPTRKIVPKAIIDLTDPDLTVTSVTGDYDATVSFTSQLTDRDAGYSGGIYATGELNRWLLDGSFSIFPDTPLTRAGEQGVIGDTLSDDDYENGTTLVIDMGGVDTLQLVTVACTGLAVDGYATELTLNIYSNGTLLYSDTQEPTGSFFLFEGFTVIQPTELELVVNKWSLPHRRYRFVEFLAGFVEVWGGETIYSMDIIQKSDFSNLTMPYSCASLTIDNTSKRFDPANKQGVFASVVARQPVPLFYGVQTGDTYSYVSCGVYYQQNLGWQLTNDGLTIQWNLIDIIGLLVDRKFELIGTQPTKLSGWIKEIVDQLGTTFSGFYTIDGNLGNTSLVCDPSALTDISCGDLLRFVCQASNSYAVSDPETGYLHIRELNNTTQDYITMRMQNTVAGSQANTDIAFLSYDLGGTLYNIAGTAEISDQTVNIQNPFITTQMKAIESAQMVLQQYGGDVLDLRVRGDMSREIGDAVSVEVLKNVNVSARIQEQHLSIKDGVMTNLPLRCLQANGGTMYTDVWVINESGTYTMQSGVTEIALVLIGGGDGGDGGDGATCYYFSDKDAGVGGLAGQGGKVYSTPLTINDGQTFVVSIGQGGTGGKGGKWSLNPYKEWESDTNKGSAGTAGTPTTCTFSTTFSSASGVRMPTGYADLLTNKIYALNGQDGLKGARKGSNGATGKPNTGWGGGGGDGGGRAVVEWLSLKDWKEASGIYRLPHAQQYLAAQANGWYYEWGDDYERAVIKSNPTKGMDGGNGGSGCVLIFWARE